uniref:Uncharacterized protein n=1 Tax=Anopheles arabiensis TaxID=7173 RepID=A0A182IH51_ANOAR
THTHTHTLSAHLLTLFYTQQRERHLHTYIHGKAKYYTNTIQYIISLSSSSHGNVWENDVYIFDQRM